MLLHSSDIIRFAMNSRRNLLVSLRPAGPSRGWATHAHGLGFHRHSRRQRYRYIVARSAAVRQSLIFKRISLAKPPSVPSQPPFRCPVAESMTQNILTDKLTASAQRHLDELTEWLKIPSISSDTSHKNDVQRAGKWVADKLAAAGLDVEIVPTDGHPMVLAQTPSIPDAPVVLVYGHYDVQPVEPLDQWVSGPFDPTVRDGNLYARGATDDKGQVLTHVQSVCEWLGSGQPLPLQVKFLIEGEEEVGSANLERMLPQLRERLACDCVVISDSSQYADGQPAITYGFAGSPPSSWRSKDQAKTCTAVPSAARS